MQDRIKLFVETLEGMDTTDIGMVGDKTIDRVVHNWGDVSYVTVTPDPDSVTVCGDRFTGRAELEIRFVDQGVRTLETIVTGTDECEIMGLTSMTVLQIPA